MIRAVVDDTYQSLERIRQEIDRLAEELGTDWFRLHDLLPLLEALSAQREAGQLVQSTDSIFRAFLILQRAEERATALQRQLGEAQSWLRQAEAGLAHWETQFQDEYGASDS